MLVDAEKFALCGLGDTGAVEFDDEQLRTLRDIGVICRDPAGSYRYPEHDQAFFRRRRGDGVCDDLALIWVGAHHGWAGLLGAFVMDAIDTYDKFLLDLTWGGYDGWLARRIQQHFRDREGRPLVGDREILDLIAFAAKRNEPPVTFSSSHRRLIQTERESAVPTLLNHWQFLQGDPVFDIQLGFSRVPAKVFYAQAHARLQAAGLDVREPEDSRWSGAVAAEAADLARRGGARAAGRQMVKAAPAPGFDSTDRRPPCRADDGVGDGQAQSGAAGLGGEVGLEEPVQVGGRDARTLVPDHQFDRRLPALAGQVARLQLHAAAPRHGLPRVHQQVAQHLGELARIRRHRLQVRRQVRLQAQAAGAEHQFGGLKGQGAQVQGLPVRFVAPGEDQQLGHQVAGPAGGGLDVGQARRGPRPGGRPYPAPPPRCPS